VQLVPGPWLDKEALVHCGTDEDVIGQFRLHADRFQDNSRSLDPDEIASKFCGFLSYHPQSIVQIYLFLPRQKFCTVSRLSVDFINRHRAVGAEFVLRGRALQGLTTITQGRVYYGVSIADAPVDAALCLFVEEYRFFGHT
jgi:hypothetical protein